MEYLDGVARYVVDVEGLLSVFFVDVSIIGGCSFDRLVLCLRNCFVCERSKKSRFGYERKKKFAFSMKFINIWWCIGASFNDFCQI